MKYRSDFVTNSSSSSFVLCFSSEDNILKALAQSFDVGGTISYRQAKCFGIVLNDVLKNKKHTVREVLEAVENCGVEKPWIDDDDVFYALDSLLWECEWEAREQARDSDPTMSREDATFWARKTAEGKACVRNMLKDKISRLYDLNPDSILVGVEYEDQSDDGYELENNILPYLPETVLVVSNH